MISDTYDLKYDAENRLIEVKKNNSVVATYVYNADGARVKSTVNGVTTAFINNYYEWTSSTTKRYYYAGTTRLAERAGPTLIYMFGDHLGSTSRSYRVDNGGVSTLLYTAWGESRYYNGVKFRPRVYQQFSAKVVHEFSAKVYQGFSPRICHPSGLAIS